ncbi:MAG: beta-N-acetylglucosaminidase domain-containing protein [Fibrobacterota bacterium]
MLNGYIEGYYGRLYSWQERRSLIETAGRAGMKAWIHAPKEDPYHRLRWYETPGTEYLREMKATAEHAHAAGVKFIPALAPGISFDFTSDTDRAALLDRVADCFACGAQTFALLFDDIELSLPDSARQIYGNAARAQIQVLSLLQRHFPEKEFLFCPTVYSRQLNTGSEAKEYLQIVSEELPPNTRMFWTGEQTVSPRIDRRSLQDINALMGDRILLWDNYYCNDYAPNRLFTGLYHGRCLKDIEKYTQGVMINGCGLLRTDGLILSLFAAFLKTGESREEHWQTHAARAGVPPEVRQLLPWISNPFEYPDPRDLKKNFPDPLQLFNRCIVDWNSPLKMEWYPSLHNLFTELKFLTGRYITTPKWFEMRFPPRTARMLKERYLADTEKRDSHDV